MLNWLWPDCAWIFVRSILPIFMILVSPVTFGETGVWAKSGSSAQLHTRCLQTWKCGPKEDIIYGGDKILKATSPKSTLGVCSAGDGPIDSCNYCLANPPKDTCTWTLENRTGQ